MDIYLDNASTTFPKPKIVTESMCNFITHIGGNSGRSNHSNSLDTNRILYNTRELLADFFNFHSPQNVIFTNNITTSLNVLLNGIIQNGDHIITSSMEHNSVIRPLYKLKNELDISVDIVSANIEGFIDPIEISKLIKCNTKVVVLSQASNVTGSIQPIKKIGQICKDNNIFFILDSAQGAGVLNTDFNELNLSALAFTGHKNLLGPQGTGGFIIDDNLNEICNPLIVGGTGSLSESLYQPEFLPDKFESGTLNMPGIVGLYSSIQFIKSEGLDTIYNYNKELHNYFINELLNIDNVDFYGDKTALNSTTCVSFNLKNIDTSELSFELDRTYGIKNRSGLHCAPLAHKTIGSYPTGAVRLSFSYFNKISELDYTLKAISDISKSIL